MPKESTLKKKEMETGDMGRYLSGMGKFKFYYNRPCRHAGVHRSSLRCLLHQHENLSWGHHHPLYWVVLCVNLTQAGVNRGRNLS